MVDVSVFLKYFFNFASDHYVSLTMCHSMLFSVIEFHF